MTTLLKKSLALTLSLLMPAGQAWAASNSGLPPKLPGGEIPASGVEAPQLPAGAPLAPAAVSLPPAAAAAAAAQLEAMPGAIRAGLTPVPVSIAVPEKTLERLTPAQRADAQAMAGFLQERLFAWERFTVALPGTIFDGAKGGLISVGDLFQSPTSEEVGEIGRSDGGQGPRLTEAQRAEIRRTGRFTVPSVRYPGQNHVWQLSNWLQKGRENIAETQRGHEAGALAQFIVQIPDRFTGKSAPSLRRSGVNLGQSLYELGNILVGLPSTRAARGEAEIRQAVEDAILKPFRELAAKGRYDGRLLDDKLMEKAAPLIRQVQESAEAFWRSHEEEMRAIAEKTGDGRTRTPQELADALAELRNKNLYGALTSDKALETLSPGLGGLLVQNARAQVLVQGVLESVRADAADYAEKTRAELSAAHPVKALIPAWLDGEVAARASAYAAAREEHAFANLPALLREQGFGPQAGLLEAELLFRAGVEPLLRETLGRERLPNRTFGHSRRIWRASRWVITKRESGDRTYYEVRKHDRYEVSSRSLFWRVANGAARAFTWWNNALYHILVSNLWNGPLGVKSLVYASEFKDRWEVDQKDGSLVRAGETGTLLSRIRASWKSRREILDAFEKDKDYGFLGKGVRRFLMYFSVDFVRGFLAPAIIFVGQPLLTAVNLAFALLALATSLAWAPAASLLNWAFNAAVYDLDRGAQYKPFALPRNLLPVADRVIGGLAVGGLLQALVSVLAVPVHALWGGVQEVFGLLRTGAREAWDWAMRGIVNWRGRVPPRDYRLFLRRIAGPGLTAEHYFQVHPDLVLVALQAELESDAVGLYDKAAQEAAYGPSRAYAALMNAVGAVTGHDSTVRSPAYADIAAKEKPALEALQAAVRERGDLLGRLLSVPERQRIKLAKQEQEAVLKKSVVLTRNFYTAYFKAQDWSGALVARFWKDAGLAAGDWEGLAKARLSGVFGAAFLTPLEDADKSLKIEVQTPGLSDYARGLESGILPEDLKDIVLTGGSEPAKPQPAVSRVPEASELVTARLLAGSRDR